MKVETGVNKRHQPMQESMNVTMHSTAAGMRLRGSFTGVLMIAAMLALPNAWSQSLEPSSLELLQEPGSIDPGFFRLRGAGTNGKAIGTFTTSGEFSPSRLVAIGRDDARQIVDNGEELVNAAGVALGAVTRLLGNR